MIERSRLEPPCDVDDRNKKEAGAEAKNLLAKINYPMPSLKPQSRSLPLSNPFTCLTQNDRRDLRRTAVTKC
jgi:hypothetical protein